METKEFVTSRLLNKDSSDHLLSPVEISGNNQLDDETLLELKGQPVVFG